jgi:hypothetical protein
LIPDNFISIAGTVGGGFFVGILIGWALKKIIKLFAVQRPTKELLGDRVLLRVGGAGSLSFGYTND